MAAQDFTRDPARKNIPSMDRIVRVREVMTTVQNQRGKDICVCKKKQRGEEVFDMKVVWSGSCDSTWWDRFPSVVRGRASGITRGAPKAGTPLLVPQPTRFSSNHVQTPLELIQRTLCSPPLFYGNMSLETCGQLLSGLPYD
jgi:hypothetical protein